MFNNKNILITGGTGSFGSLFIKKILKNYKPKKLIIYSRDELKQLLISKKIKNPALRFFIGDVRDGERLSLAMEGVDYVVHALCTKTSRCRLNIIQWNALKQIYLEQKM